MVKNILGLLILLIFLQAEDIKIDANGDGIKDVVSYIKKDLQKYPDLDEPLLDITIKTKLKSYRFNSYYSTNNTNISSCGSGCILISQSRGGYSGVDLKDYYIFDKQRDYWFLEKTIEGNIVKKLDKSKRIDYILDPKFTLSEFLLKCKEKNIEVLNSLNEEYINFYLNKYLLSIKNLTTYNDIAYYLQKKEMNKEAIYLLEKILKKYPNRTVAYYNLGDAYWEIGDKEKAIKAYKTYIEQMKTKGKEKRIPKKIKNRVIKA